MKRIVNKLEFKVWTYLISFSVIIILFLYFFQVLSLRNYYEISVKREISETLEKIKTSYNNEDYENVFNGISNKTDICIEVYQESKRLYSSNSCRSKFMDFIREKKEFLDSEEQSKGYEIFDKNLDAKTLLYGIKLDDNKVAFVQASLVPLDSTVNILRGQLLILSVIVLSLSLLIAIFISKKISNPIESINTNAKKLAKGEYGIEFETTTDIEEIKELNNTLNKTSIELAKTEKLRKEIMANVTHDLKTPLTMIKAYAEMIRDLNGNNKKKREANLNVIISETDRLNLLVNDLLDKSKYDAGTIKLEREDFDLDELIKEILSRYEIYIEKDKYNITYESDGKTIINADRNRISQVIYNLINNALNYTGSDKKITIKLNKGRFEVIDTGKGIKEEELDLIWDKYYKIDKSYSRMQIGSGIGLSIVKNILELHDYKYGVSSILGKGTTFYFEAK